MFVYKVWRDGYEGCDRTDSHWFSWQKAKERCDKLQIEDPDTITGMDFEWEVVTIEMEDDPEIC